MRPHALNGEESCSHSNLDWVWYGGVEYREFYPTSFFHFFLENQESQPDYSTITIDYN